MSRGPAALAGGVCALVLGLALVTGCGPDGGDSGSDAPKVSESELAEMHKLVDGAESAAGEAEQDAAEDPAG